MPRPSNILLASSTALLLAALWACAQTKRPADPSLVTKETVASFYQGFQRLTKEPYFVADTIAIRCTRTPPEEAARIRKSPHLNSSVHFYANPPAVAAVSRQQPAFPAGAIFVKEKLAADGSIAGIGGMIKRSLGFDTPNGDWEFFYSDRSGGFTIGKIKTCAECHSGTYTRDGVFRAWQFIEK
jgi:hypothetical protein